jgi:hypothetical protein
VLAFLIIPDLEDHRAQAAIAPPDCTIPLGIITLMVDQIRLIEDPLRFLQAEA